LVRAAIGVRLDALAAHLGREFDGDGGLVLEGVASLANAGPQDLCFLRHGGPADALASCAALALIAPVDVEVGSRSVIRSPDPTADFARAAAWLCPPTRPDPGIHLQAVVAPGAEIHASASVGAGCVVGEGCKVGARTILHPNVTLYPGVHVGEDCEIHAQVVLREGTLLGQRVLLQPGAVIGAEGFGFASGEGDSWRRVPQLGRVVIEDDVEIGANSTIDRATLDETWIRRGAKIDNLVQIAHNCDVGEDVMIVAQSGLSGSTLVGRRALLMAQSGSAGHLEIGAGAFVGARAGLRKDVDPGARVWGAPQMEERRWHRSMSALMRLPDVLKRLRAIERKLGLRPGRQTGDDPHEEEE
jgi:UDP-3-O-[3-hydroxymyristoyl] glucosamine N-acyltransferase